MYPFPSRLFFKSLLFSLQFIFFDGLYANAQLNADFTVNKTGGCAPLAISFTNTTSGTSAGAVYLWDLGNGNTSTIQNPGAIYNDEKTYTVTLTVKDGAQTSTKTSTITVYTPPLADFTATPVKDCLPAIINFTASSGGQNNTYTWDYGDGNTENTYSVSASHTYIVSQTATVSLTVGNAYGCTKTIQKDNLVKILPAISANFTASKTILCRVTDAVQFSNTSAGPGTLTYLWNFGDGTTSTLAAPSHVFNKRGTYTVALTVTSSEGCIATTSLNGNINVADFTSDFTQPPLICNSTEYASFTNVSTPFTTNYVWTLDGVDQYSYGNLYTAFPNTGSHTIKLTNTFGTCIDSVSKTIIVKKSPVLDGFLSTITGNCGAPVLCNFKDSTSDAVKWEWNFNQTYYSTIESQVQAPSYIYLSDGGYYPWLRVTNAAGCTATTSKYIGIVRPFVSISSEGNTAACGPFSLKYLATCSDSITTYRWNFGDGGTSTKATPTHLFSTTGNWPVTLSYLTAAGCTGTISYNTVFVYTKPTAAFSAVSTNICGNTPVIFNATYQGGNFSYYWDFGDNSGLVYNFNSSAVSHQYVYDSTYTVTLIVANQGGCQDTMIQKNYIKVLPPFPKITGVVNTCDGTRGLVSFSQASQKSTGWTWDFGDGISRTNVADSPNVSHTYTKTGTYKTVLINTNGQCSVRDSVVLNVLLKQSPKLSANVNTICNIGSINFKVDNLENNPAHYTYNNDYNITGAKYNDGTPYAGYIQNNSNSYYWTTVFDGNFNNFATGHTAMRVTLISSNFQCADTTNFIPLTILGSNAGFNVLNDGVCFKTPVLFKDTSKTNSKIVSWQWNFGDGNVQVLDHGGTVSHRYLNPGQYNVVLTITDAGGCASSTSNLYQYVSVSGPGAAFNPSSSNTYITLPVTFYNNTNNYNSPNTTYGWTFGDGSSSTDYYPTHTYNNPGNFTVKLIATNPATGCSDTVSQVIVVNNFISAFSLNNNYLTGAGCPPVLVKMTNNSYNYSSVKWDFGDGTSADNLNYPSHIYEKPGKYIITLYVYGPSGLTGTFQDSINILLPNGNLKTNKKEGCIGFTPTLSATSSNTSTYLWDYGDGTVSANNNIITTHQYNQPGKYFPSLLLSDSNGCSAAAILPDAVIVHANPVITIAPQDPRICLGQSVNIIASGGVIYSWSPALGLSNAAIANPVANPVVTSNYGLTVKDNIGCTSNTSQKITVVQPGKTIVSANTAVCLGKSVQLTASGNTAYQWIITTDGLSDTRSGNPLASPVITTTYTVTGTDEFKCFTDTATVTVKVLPLPTVSIAPLPEILLGTQIPFNSMSSSDVIAWKWSPADYLNCTNCANPVSIPLAEKIYTLTVTNNNGCIATATVQLKVQCDQSRVFIPGAFSPNGDGKNDVFSVMGISVVKHMIIYNRWGTPVYERSNYIASERSSGWDGTYKGDPLPAGTYAYFAEMDCPSGGSFTRKGTVILIR